MGRSARPQEKNVRGRPRRARRDEPGVIFSRQGRVTKRGAMKVTWKASSDWAPSLDAVMGVDHISDALLAHHLVAIEDGERPAGGGQRPLNPQGHQGRLAKRGERPGSRGFTARAVKPFAANITRTEIKVRKGSVKTRLGGQGTRAKAFIQPASTHGGWVTKEADKGVEFFAASGDSARVVDIAVAQWAGAAIGGVLKAGDTRQRKAAKAKNL